MKKFQYILFTFLLVFGLASCSDDFLDTAPTDAVSEDAVFATVENARAAINGIHRSMYFRRSVGTGGVNDSQDEGGHASVGISIDVLGEDIVHPSTNLQWFSFDMFWESHRDQTASLPDYVWDVYYGIIGAANIIVANIDDTPGAEGEKNEIKAQALAYRAFAYFNLVRLYGQRYVAGSANEQLGVPLYLEPTLDPQGRSTVARVYEQINMDLDDAIDLFEDTPDRFTKNHLDLSVARGLKARVALTQENYDVAISNAVAARNGYTLMSSMEYQSGFNDLTNNEWIWGANVIEDQNIFFAGFHAFMSFNYSSSNIRGNPKLIFEPLYSLFPSTDVRTTLFDDDGLDPEQLPRSDALTFPLHATKFASVGSSPSSAGDHPYMRASEMYLIEAEARQKNGDDPGAAQALFELNSVRDPSYTLSANTGQDLLTEIWNYRRLELWGEGFRFYDLKRNNLPLDRMQGVGNHNASGVQNLWTVPAGDKRWEFLIPQAEIDNNAMLADEQNEI